MLSRETMSIQAKRQLVRHLNRQDWQLALNMAVTQSSLCQRQAVWTCKSAPHLPQIVQCLAQTVL